MQLQQRADQLHLLLTLRLERRLFEFLLLLPLDGRAVKLHGPARNALPQTPLHVLFVLIAEI